MSKRRVCVRGHVVADDNQYLDPAGRRVCRSCIRILQNRRRARRSLSCRASTYRRFAAVCERNGKSISGALEELLAPVIANEPDPGPDAFKAKSAKPEYGPVVPLDEAFPPRFL